MKFKHSLIALTLSGMISAPLLANPIEDIILNSEHVLIGKDETADGLGGVATYVMTESGLISQGYAINTTSSGSFTITSDADTTTITTDAFDSLSYIFVDVFSEEARNGWGDSVIDQLEQAYLQGLVDQYQQYDSRTGIEAIEISNYNEDDGSVNLQTTRFNTLIIPENVVENIEGGWEGPTEIIVASTSEPTESNLVVVEKSSLINIDDFREKQWVLPFYANIDFYYGSQLSIASDISGDISSGVGQSEVLSIPFAINYSENIINVATDAYTYEYLPYAQNGDDIEVLVKAYEDGELVYLSTNFLVQKKDNTSNFTKHLTTTFPFIQLAYINGREKFRYDENGRLECGISVWGYVFNKNSVLNRGITCDEESEVITTGDDRWTWSVDEKNQVHQNFEADTYTRKRTWVPLATDENGFTRVLEYSNLKADWDSDGTIEEDGYLIHPRINLVKLEDLSQYEEIYTNSGFQGDYDGDGVNDSNDNDDDNDGMSDYYENKYSLNHLDASDASDDNDADGLTNLQEFRAGTDPSGRDSDNDGVPDGLDSDPLDASVSATSRIFQARHFDDVDGDYFWDWYVATEYEDGYEVVIRSGKDDEVLQTLFWNQDYTNAQIVHLDDMNGDGVKELGLFGFVDFVGENDSLKKAQLFVKDPTTGNRVVVHNWPGNWSDVKFLLATDSDNDGVIDVAIQGKFKEGNRPQLFVKNAVTGEKQALHSYPSIYSNTEYNWFEDFDGDGTQDISMIGQKSNGKIQVRISSGKNGANLGVYNYPANYSDFTWRYAGDINADGNRDYGLLGKRLDDGRVQFFTKSGVSQSGTLGIYTWPEMTNFELFRVRDLTGDDQREFALVGFRESSSRYQMIVKDGRDRGNTLTTAGWPDNWDEVSFVYLGDIDGDTELSTEIGLVGRHKTNGSWQMSLRSTTGANLGQVDLGTEWDSKPSLDYSVDNGTLRLFVFGEASGVSTSKMISFSPEN
ncbi:hypothetical protein [Alteromonas mediterranea]|uniref:VCBS repeat-containing protein n=1 Tax=Alteromonas mediterranea TaxID=314275 RepID=A0AAC9AE67_9ALTE|nr:hypothetical protein [Alteromonas mediterranea]MBR9785117.1 hypothetical protein [Gammaproteobacteria bacterium]AFV87036.1 hypothetical protein amad1_17785 [Alteromonas mediterranea DE1]AGP99051.1 hypothetical protein I635_17750 [Alteromonas mediterranea UM7]AMJ79956.1 hypothetical protein AV942_17520 [Alteromonas mediterranea]AMJ84111.1 hypothetical protein AV941_17595 [Alteromonas mediterranea]|tara:strand:- start:1038 stop:3947 length:2910 start_codon:yes stop_codon:yes gene_type:complete